MSQEKVNKHKEEKANRKVILKKEKRKKIAGRIAGSIVCLAIVGWLGYSAYDSVTKNMAASQTDINLSGISDYLNNLNTTTESEE